jgi:tetratricopeptide (TPR) repeat protein
MAIADLSRSVEADPNYARAYCLRGIAYSKKLDTKNGIADFEQAIRIDANYAAAYRNRAAAFAGMGDNDKALSDYGKAIELDRGNASAYVGRAGVYRAMGNHNNAIIDCEDALRLDPGNAEAKKFLEQARKTQPAQKQPAPVDLPQPQPPQPQPQNPVEPPKPQVLRSEPVERPQPRYKAKRSAAPVIVGVALAVVLIAAGALVLSGYGGFLGKTAKKTEAAGSEAEFSREIVQKPGLEPIRVTQKELFYIPVIGGNGFYKYVTLDGKDITEAKYIRAYIFQEGRALVQRKDSLWGYIDTDGNSVAGAYTQALSYKDGMAWVNDNGTIKALNLNGRATYTLPDNVISVWSFYDGMALFSMDGWQGYMDRGFDAVGNGQTFFDGNRFQENMASVTCDNGKYGYIDANARIIIDCNFDEAKVFKNSRAIVKSNNGWGVINKNGNYLFGPFSAVEMMNTDEDMFKFKAEGKWGWLDSKGKIVLPAVYDEIMSFDDRDIAPVKQDEKWGYIDKSGTYVINRQYDAAYPFFNNRALVRIGDNFVTIDRNGTIDLQTGSKKIDPSYWNFINSGIVGGPRIMSVEPSFKCDAAGLSYAEKIICRSVALAQTDRETDALYKRVLRNDNSVAGSQKAFLSKRNACRDVDCIESVYARRNEELSDF